VQTEEEFGRPLETVIYQNTDPRVQSDQAVEEAEGAQFIVIHLASGMYLCGPNAGYDFSLIKSKIEEVYLYRGLEKGSQFRSRDNFPRVVAHLMDALEDDLDLEEVSSNIIPSLDGFYIGHIDNFGNIKTTITREDIKEKYEYDDQVTIKINNVEKKARYVTSLFGGSPGELVIYPGSSGVKDNPYLEITVWRHFTEEEKTTGVHAFNNPIPGMKVELL
jgi:S-adenosylmethionine hydrolase